MLPGDHGGLIEGQDFTGSVPYLSIMRVNKSCLISSLAPEHDDREFVSMKGRKREKEKGMWETIRSAEREED